MLGSIPGGRTFSIVKTIIVIKMSAPLVLYLLLTLFCMSVQAQGIRDHTRPTHPRDTFVNESQAQILSLALAEADTYQLQSWVRMAGQVDDSGHRLVATHCFSDADLVQVGQRVVAFLPDTKSSMSQARVSRIDSVQSCIRIEAVLATAQHETGRFYVMEVLAPRGHFLAVPKEAIIEEEGRSLVYVQSHESHYLPRPIHTGIKGELYTQVLSGLKQGERVVTLGSFFVHAEHSLGERSLNESSHAHHTH